MSGAAGRTGNSFDDLNAALFAQMDRLASAEGEEAVQREIARSEAVGTLAANVIGNTKNAIGLLRLQMDEGMDMAGMVATRPRMLGGGR